MKRSRPVLSAFIGLLSAVAVPALAQHQPHQPQAAPQQDGLQHNANHGAPEISREEFNRLLPDDPKAALQFVFDKMNEGAAKNNYTSIRLDLVFVPSLPDGKLSDLQPEMEGEGDLVLRLKVVESAAHNPVLALEELARLKALMGYEQLGFQVFGQKKSLQQHYIFSPHPKTGQPMWHPHHYKWIHVVRYVYHEMLEFMGIRTVPMANGNNPMVWSELKINARSGSILSQRELLEVDNLVNRSAYGSIRDFVLLKRIHDDDIIRKSLAQLASANGFTLDLNQPTDALWASYFQQKDAKIQTALQAKTAEAKKDWGTMRKRYLDPSKSAIRTAFEKNQAALDQLVVRNDREGVAKLFEAFLPFDLMEPMERGLWEEWIDSIRHPDFKNAKILFRGIDNNDDVRVTKDAAGNEVGFGFFSTMLVASKEKSYTTRLREFDGMRTRFGVPSVTAATSPLQSVPKMTQIMINHSNSPNGSPFMSFSTNPMLAYGFATPGGGLLIARIDPRRQLPNVVSNFKSELEILIPLVVFPDEVVHYERIPGNADNDVSKKPSFDEILARASAKLGQPIAARPDRDFKTTFAEGYKVFDQAEEWLRAGGMCRTAFK